jgi:ABC-2 type transport system ATP-binding protein
MELLVENIRKHYGRKSVLNGAGFSAGEGSCVGILGANGTGKSTLLRILAGVLRADGGSARWQGEDLLKNASLRQRTVAYVPQGTPLIEELSARDNLRLWYEPEALEASLEAGLLRRLGVGDFLKTPASRLSGGMRKRLSIGCAMARDPQILLLDEPTAALDLVCREQLLESFERFRRDGGLVVLVTHDEREIRMCRKLFLLRGGLLEPYAYGGDPRALMRDLEEP